MPVNGFTVGRDVTLTFVTGSGPLNVNLITGFQCKQDSVQEKIKGLDGVTRPLRFFDSWSGRFNVERQDNTLDVYFAQLEANFYQGLPETSVTLTETIQEVDGSISQFRYVGVMLMYDDAGEFRGDQSVKQTVSFTAIRRIAI